MNSNWNTKTLPNFGGHHRSASVVGYQDTSYSDYESSKYNHSWLNSNQGTYYNSSMDISKTKPDSNDFQKFLWNSPSRYHPSKSVSTYSESADHSQKQRPFETAFKSAIIKLKESSLSRLGTVEQNIPTVKLMKDNFANETDEFYQRKCQTLQPSRKYSTNSTKTDSKRNIFRCEIPTNKNQFHTYSVSKVSKEITSDSESDTNTKYSQYKSNNGISEDSNKNSKMSISSEFQYSSKNKGTKSGSSVVIPVKDNKKVKEPKESSLVKTEVFISPSLVKTNESSFPQSTQFNKDNSEDDLNFEPLPSVQEIISKVEALNNQSDKNIMSKSLNITNEKPPILLNYRTGSQRNLENYNNSVTNSDILTSAPKRMSGLYKKNMTNTIKGKSVANMPSDFQKLHMAFLDQKQEIQRLRQELTEKNELISHLETSLKNYEPWR